MSITPETSEVLIQAYSNSIFDVTDHEKQQSSHRGLGGWVNILLAMQTVATYDSKFPGRKDKCKL